MNFFGGKVCRMFVRLSLLLGLVYLPNPLLAQQDTVWGNFVHLDDAKCYSKTLNYTGYRLGESRFVWHDNQYELLEQQGSDKDVRLDYAFVLSRGGDTLETLVYSYDQFTKQWRKFLSSQDKNLTFTTHGNGALKVLQIGEEKVICCDESGYRSTSQENQIECNVYSTYDAHGNLLTQEYKDCGSFGLAYTNHYDEEGNLLSQQFDHESSALFSGRFNYWYDKQGRLIKEREYELNGADSIYYLKYYTTYLYDSQDLPLADEMTYTVSLDSIQTDPVYFYEMESGKETYKEGVMEAPFISNITNYLNIKLGSDVAFYDRVSVSYELNFLGDTIRKILLGHDPLSKGWYLLDDGCENKFTYSDRTFNEDGSLSMLHVFDVKFFYDEEGYFDSIQRLNEGGLIHVTCDDYGHTTSYETAREKSRCENAYDEKHNLIRKSVVCDNGDTLIFDYTYDNQDRCMRAAQSRLSSQSDGTPTLEKTLIFSYGAPASKDYLAAQMNTVTTGLSILPSENSFYVIGNTICVDAPNGRVQIFDAHGRLVGECVGPHVSMKVDKAGLYFVKIGEASAKVVVR